MAVKQNNIKPVRKVQASAVANHFPIVAIGASAGGLEAMTDLLLNLPPDTGMAFIYVQHLSPDHKSLLTEILSNKTKMKVQEIDDTDKIKPNNVFVIPYNKGIEVTDDHIKLIPRSESSTAISIDILFSSLAHAHKERVIGIVLSGSASDGTVGIRDIKHEGGLTFAQDDSAKFNSMPHSAIAAGVVDFILPPKEIAFELARLSKHPFVKSGISRTLNEGLIDNSDPDLKKILNKLHNVTGVDFSAYKLNTIKRRIIRRMLLYKISSLKAYAKLLTHKAEETGILYQDLLINVTSFFRDADTHKYLKEFLLPKLLKMKKDGESLRIWVPACATGEEAYSIAMILLEINESQTGNVPIQIFATDLSENAVNRARIGTYSKQELETVSPKRIQRFFTKSENSYRINKTVRDMVVFAPQNILSDPPFSRLDLISCCNLLIYLDMSAQKKALNTFHYALNNDGFLMLGKSENISQSPNLFTSANKKYKIFARKMHAGLQRLPELSPRAPQQVHTEKNQLLNNRSRARKLLSSVPQGLDNSIDDLLVNEFMPASVLIDRQMEIIQFRGATELFLTHPKGKATFNVLKLARPEIAFELRIAILKAIKTKRPVKQGGIELKIKSKRFIVSFEIVPLKIQWNEPLLLVVFREHEQSDMLYETTRPGKLSLAKDRRIKKLEEQLMAAHTVAISTLQEQEAFAEELQSANEEVVSSNEELQTVNEELETSKEEIESTNEELTTTIHELQTRIDLLKESYEYSDAIISTMHEPMLVLGKDLRVKYANEAFYSKFGLEENQTEGKLLYDLGNKQWDIPALRELLEDIIPQNSRFYNYEVKHTFLNLGEKIMSLNASRLIQKTHREQLILLVIADITEVRRLMVEKERIELEMLNKEILQRSSEKLKLENAVDKRTQALKKANEQLEIKNMELLNMNKELEAFTYVSSHDLQEPLRKLQTFSGLILDKENEHLSEKGKTYFKHIQESAERMRQLIQDLLAFSRISAADRKFSETKLSSIVEEVKAEFKDAIKEKKAVIELTESCKVKIIPFQFRQLMHNMISNALKYARPKKPPFIQIKVSKFTGDASSVEGLIPGKDYTLIRISDNGIGFEQKFNIKIFELFQKLHGREVYPGTGIGLAIVKKIVANHNGIITAKGQLNKGATFELYIPLTQKK